MEVVPSIESYAGPKKDKYVWLKWTMAALIAVLNGYAAVMMYASGEWCLPCSIWWSFLSVSMSS